MSGGVQRLKREPFDADPVAVADPDRHDIGLGLLAHHRDAMRALAERFEPGDVIGVEMGVDRLHQPEVEFVQELNVAIDPFEHGIDDERLPAMAAREQIGVGAGGLIEELPENHFSSFGRVGPSPLFRLRL